MTPYKKRMDPFIQRMVGDMQLRNLADATINAYTYHVDKFCQFFGKPADQLGPEEIRQYQLYLVNYGKRPKKLPVVLSNEEASRLFECIDNPKHRAVILTIYATGMRLRETTHLRVADIDGTRAQIRICCGKGSKERVVPASPRLLGELREYWKLTRPRNYLFPGRTPDVPLSSATIQKAFKLALAKAGIQKPATPRTMRHSWATGMLEAGVDLLTISKLLGHASFVTTMIYLHVRRQHFDRSPSPIDWLPVRQCPKWAEPQEPSAAPQPTAIPRPDETLAASAPSSQPRPQRRMPWAFSFVRPPL